MITNVSSNTVMATSTTRNSARNIQLPEIPDHIITNGQSSTSDDRFREKILEMARSEVAAGRKTRTQTHHGPNSSQFHSMMNDFTSSASPDRRGVINSTLSDLGSRLQKMMPRLNLGANLLQMLMGHSSLFGNRDIGSNFINFRDSNGNVIAMFSELPTGGWGFTNVSTPAENARTQEFMQMWDDDHRQASDEHHMSQFVIDSKRNGVEIDLGERIGRGQQFNMEKLARHGITLDAETGQTVVNPSITGGQSANLQTQQQLASRYAANLNGN